MLKAIGLLIIIAVGTGAGFYLSQGLRERQKRLFKIGEFIEDVTEGISRGEDIFTIVEKNGQSAEIYAQGYSIKCSHRALLGQDISAVEDFLLKLGMGDRNSQLKRCGIYKEIIKKREENAGQQVLAKAGLYGRIGFFAGLFVAVLLI